jgi:hypothetical protein
MMTMANTTENLLNTMKRKLPLDMLYLVSDIFTNQVKDKEAKCVHVSHMKDLINEMETMYVDAYGYPNVEVMTTLIDNINLRRYDNGELRDSDSEYEEPDDGEAVEAYIRQLEENTREQAEYDAQYGSNDSNSEYEDVDICYEEDNATMSNDIYMQLMQMSE